MEQKRVRTYLFYAIGEILLVVIGILIALQINNWNVERIEKNLEKVYLQNLIVDLENQLLELDRHKKGELYNQDALKRVASLINNRFENVDLERYNQDMQSIMITRTLNLYDATFEDLKSTGNLNLIRNEKVKQDILNYFQFSERNVYVIRKNAEGYHQTFTQGFMNSHLVNFNLGDMRERVQNNSALMDSFTTLSFEAEIESSFNDSLEKRLKDLYNQQIVKNVITNRWWTNQVALLFLNEMEIRTDELIGQLKKELN